MIVGVVAVAVMQAPVVDEIDMGAVLHRHVLLALMAVGVIVGGDARDQFLAFGVGGADLERMFVDMAVVGVVEVTVVQVIDMARMLERLMAAGLAVGMGFMAGVQHLVGKRGRSEKGQRERRAEQGSMHHSGLHKRRSRTSTT